MRLNRVGWQAIAIRLGDLDGDSIARDRDELVVLAREVDDVLRRPGQRYFDRLQRRQRDITAVLHGTSTDVASDEGDPGQLTASWSARTQTRG